MIIVKNPVSRAALKYAPAPQRTNTWAPVSHSLLANSAANALEEAGFTIEDERHGLARNGLRYFGGFKISRNDLQDNTRKLVFGIRNGNDRTMSAAACAGMSMIVCENMSFSSEVKLAQRHVVNVEDRLPIMLAGVIARLSESFEDSGRRISNYQNTEVGIDEVCKLAIDMAERKAISPRLIFPIVQEFKNPRHPEFCQPTLWNLYNSVTENMKGTSLSEMPARNMLLHQILDKRAGFKTALPCAIDMSVLSDN